VHLGGREPVDGLFESMLSEVFHDLIVPKVALEVKSVP